MPTTFNKVGFHAGSGPGNRGIMDDYVKVVNAAGRPAIVKAANNAGLAADVARSGQEHGVENQIILRFVDHTGFDNPDYNIPVDEAADEYWAWVKKRLDASPELQPFKDQIWIEMLNEPDKNRWGSHVGPWALRLAQLANAEGWKAALIGVNAGEPEPEHWLEPGMVEFLQYAAERPDQVAITVHEAKAPHPVDTPVANLVPHMVGRMKELFKASDRLGIAHPTVFVSEWAWAYRSMPDDPDDAMEDVSDLAAHYAQYPTVKGIYLWSLNEGPEWGDLPLKLNRLIPRMADFTLKNTFETPEGGARLGDGEPDPVPEPLPVSGRGRPRIQYDRTFNVIPGEATEDQAAAIFLEAWLRGREAVGVSFDDAGIGDLDVRLANLYGIDPAKRQEFLDWYAKHYPGVEVRFLEMPDDS